MAVGRLREGKSSSQGELQWAGGRNKLNTNFWTSAVEFMSDDGRESWQIVKVSFSHDISSTKKTTFSLIHTWSHVVVVCRMETRTFNQFQTRVFKQL